MRTVLSVVLGLILMSTGTLGVQVGDLPVCSQCCRICSQYPIDFIDDAFGETPQPVEPESTGQGATTVLKTLAPRSFASEDTQCCNVCPGFGVGHPHPLYASFLETGEEAVTAPSTAPFGFRMPPCCNTCAGKAALPAFETFLDSIDGKTMTPPPKKSDYFVKDKSAFAFVETDADVEVDEEAEEEMDMDQEEEAEVSAEDVEAIFLETSVEMEASADSQLTTHAQFELYMGRAAPTAANPEGLCRIPRNEYPQETCCNSCTAESILAFPADVGQTVKARLARSARAMSQQKKVERVVKQLLAAADGDYEAAYDQAIAMDKSLRQMMKNRKKAQGIDYRTKQKYEHYRDYISRALDTLAEGKPTPRNTLIIKILNVLNKRFYTRINPLSKLTVRDYNKGIAAGIDHKVFTGPEYSSIKTLPSNLQVLANLMLQDDEVTIDLGEARLPYPIVLPHPSYKAPRALGHMPLFPKVYVPRVYKKAVAPYKRKPGDPKIVSFRVKPPAQLERKPPAAVIPNIA